MAINLSFVEMTVVMRKGAARCVILHYVVQVIDITERNIATTSYGTKATSVKWNILLLDN